MLKKLKKETKKILKENKVLTISFAIALIVLWFDIYIDNESGKKLSEVYVSLAAFVMLIGTSIIQNIDLGLQRKDIELTRKEMKMQTKEFEVNNMQSKFFELLKSKEEIYMGVDSKEIKEFIKKYRNITRDKFYIALTNDEELIEIIPNIKTTYLLYDIPYNYKDTPVMEKLNINVSNFEDIEKCINRALLKSMQETKKEIEIPKNIEKLYKFKTIIETMYPENTFENIFFDLKNPLKAQDLNFNQIYNGLITEEEKELYKILDSNIELKDLRHF